MVCCNVRCFASQSGRWLSTVHAAGAVSVLHRGLLPLQVCHTTSCHLEVPSVPTVDLSCVAHAADTAHLVGASQSNNCSSGIQTCLVGLVTPAAHQITCIMPHELMHDMTHKDQTFASQAHSCLRYGHMQYGFLNDSTNMAFSCIQTR